MMPRIEYDKHTDKRLMEIAATQNIQDASPVRTRTNVLSFLIGTYDKLELERKARAEKERAEKEGYQKKSLDEIRELGNRHVKGSARGKVYKVISNLMADNDAAKNQQDKVFITTTYVRKYLQRMQNSTRIENIRDVYDELKTEIDAHNEKHRLDAKHNAKVAQARRRQRGALMI